MCGERVTDNYKDAPVSLGEVRASKAQSAALWAPREALVSMLRKIDGGLNVDLIVICYREKADDGQLYSNFEAAGGQSLTDSLGMISRVAYKINEAT